MTPFEPEPSGPTLTEADASSVYRAVYGRDGTAREVLGERDQSFVMDGGDGPAHVLKVSSPAEHRDALDVQIGLIQAIRVADPSLPVPEVVPTGDGSLIGAWGDGRKPHAVRLLTFLPGTSRGVTASTSRPYRHRVGNVSARLLRASRAFFHPAANRPLLWDITSAPRLRAIVGSVAGAAARRSVEEALTTFETDVAPHLPSLRFQVIHGDVSPSNLLVDPDDPDRIVGIVDFGDAIFAPLVAELAIAASFLVCEQDDPAGAIDDLRAGFEAVTPLEPLERELLHDLVRTRLAMRVAIHQWRAATSPTKRPRPSPSPVEASLVALDRLRAAGRRARRLAGGEPPPGRFPAPAEIVDRRLKVLGPGLRQFYDLPFMPVRGRGAWVEDESGRRYLDAYNNVPHVGHSHPHVVDAVERQMREITSNTRYLHPAIVEYGERLVSSMPPGLDTCLFTCTGSDANDLALRLAREDAGEDGVIATEAAYHGNTVAISGIGSGTGAGPAPWVALVPFPPHGRQPDVRAAAKGYASAVADGAEALRARGLGPAAFFFDSVFYSDGVRIPEPAVMRAALDTVRELGALSIADEVQAGEGRVGEAMWGFQLYGAVPDLVTMGKPMAGGIPVGAVVTRREIAERFFARNHYFNTYAGSPVAAAAGLAVLDVLEREGLQRNAAVVGEHLLRSLDELRRRHPLIAAVRGRGFAIGVDLRTADGRPATAAARRAINEMMRRGVLVGLAGPARNVLKIRPPMVFGFPESRFLVETLDHVLGDIGDDGAALAARTAAPAAR